MKLKFYKITLKFSKFRKLFLFFAAISKFRKIRSNLKAGYFIKEQKIESKNENQFLDQNFCKYFSNFILQMFELEISSGKIKVEDI